MTVGIIEAYNGNDELAKVHLQRAVVLSRERGLALFGPSIIKYYFRLRRLETTDYRLAAPMLKKLNFYDYDN